MKKWMIAGVLTLFCLMGISGYAETETDTAYENARDFVESITGQEFLTGEADAEVKRGEYLQTVMQTGNQDFGYNGDQIFMDVVVSDAYFPYVNSACELGFIDRGETFRPDDAITMAEAVKITLNVINYRGMANRYGGYPSGYIRMANRIGLLDDINFEMDAPMTVRDAYIMLANALQAEAVRYVGRDELGEYTFTGVEVAEEVYGLTAYEGEVVQTGAYSLLYEATYTPDTIQIGSQSFSCDKVYGDLLGYSVRAYYDKDRKLAALRKLQDNQTLEIPARDFIEVSENAAKYYDKERIESCRLSDTYRVVYNGRRVETLKEEMYKDLQGKVTLLDSNHDRTYDLIFINVSVYGRVETVDLTGKSLGFRGIPAISFEDAYDYSYLDIDGNPMDFYAIVKGDHAAVQSSADGKLVRVRILGEKLYGTYTAYQKEQGKITIDGEVYDISKYCKEECMPLLHMGAVTYQMGLDGEIAAIYENSGSGKYGYLLRTMKDNAFGTNVQFKILTTDNQLAIYPLAERVTLDGDQVKSLTVYEKMGGAQISKQLIRYAVNQAGEINMIDTAENAENQSIGEKADDKNSLRQYASRKSLRYRSSGQMFAPSIGIEPTILFVVPNNGVEFEDEDYRVIRSASLADNNDYTVDVYDVDENGSAGAALVYASAAGPLINSSDSYMVEYAASAVNEEGEEGTIIHCWRAGMAYDFFVGQDVPITKESGGGLCPGDIIRVWYTRDMVESGGVERVVVDMDNEGEGLGINTANVFQKVVVTGTNYIPGFAYSLGDKSLYVLYSTDPKTMPDNIWDNMWFCRINAGSKIAMYHRDTKTVESGNLSDVKTYLSHGKGCAYVVVRLTSSSTSDVFVYYE